MASPSASSPSSRSGSEDFDAQPDGIDDAATRTWSVKLFHCVREGTLEQLEQLLTRVNDAPDVRVEHVLEARDRQAETPLYVAAQIGKVEFVKVLLVHGANVNSRAFSRWTPLMSAAARGWPEVVRVLLDAGADTTCTDTRGRTAKDWARACVRPLFDTPGVPLLAMDDSSDSAPAVTPSPPSRSTSTSTVLTGIADLLDDEDDFLSPVRPYMAASQASTWVIPDSKVSSELVLHEGGDPVMAGHWTPEQVLQWAAHTADLDDVVSVFRDYEVDGETLLGLTEDSLDDFQLPQNAVENTLKAIGQLKSDAKVLRIVSNQSGVLPGRVPLVTLSLIVMDRLQQENMSVIGSGTFGTVYHCVFASVDGKQRDVALKVLRMPEAGRSKARFHQTLEAVRAEGLNEILCLAIAGKHPNVVQLVGICEDVPGSVGPCPVITYHEHGDLKAYLERHHVQLRETWTRNPSSLLALVRGIVAGLAHLHSKKLVHGDLKLDNIVVTSAGVPRISDFGKARNVKGSWTPRTRLFLRRMPPEKLLSDRFDERGDVWMLGLLLADLLRFQERVPFHTVKCNQLRATMLDALTTHDVAPVGIEAAVANAVPLDSPEGVQLVRVIERCLAIKWAERYECASDVLADLELMQ